MSDVRNADPTRDDVPKLDRRSPRLCEVTIRFENSSTVIRSADDWERILHALRNLKALPRYWADVEFNRLEELPDEPF